MNSRTSATVIATATATSSITSTAWPKSVKSQPKMDIFVRCLSLLLLWSHFIKGTDGKGYCRFPEFLWTPLADGSHRKWLTETEYVRNTDIWEGQKEVTAKETEIVIKHKVQASCKNKHEERNVLCERKGLLYKIVCLSEEQGDKYRVQMRLGDTGQFTCMKFKQINKNIIQIFQAEPKGINEDRLCYDGAIERQLWPWIAPTQIEWSPCPFSGGFDYGAFVNDKRQVCTRIWRPSRLESECIYGEGLVFLFPDQNCNPFGQKRDELEVRMLCWGDWTEDQFRFVVIGEINREPQFVLRLPHDLDTTEEFPAQLYFSPLAPLTLDGSVKVKKIRRLLLRMKRSANCKKTVYTHLPGDKSEICNVCDHPLPIVIYNSRLCLWTKEPGICYDESEKCSRFAQEGKCTNSALHKYANYCKRSCGVCEFVPSIRAECRFPTFFQGDWELFENDRRETVRITSTGEIEFEILGKFICKTTHWSQDHFKILSVFSNGCRPRYSCIHLESDGNKILLFRLSRAKFTDESFEMCKFDDDPLPIGNRVRSEKMKILLARPSIQWGACGLSGEVRVNSSFPDGTSCSGKLTDWNEHTCQYRTKMSLEMEYCPRRQSEDFVCIAHMSVDDSFSILITRDETAQRQFSCWTIRTYPESMSYKPWDMATKLPRAQCGTQDDMHTAVPSGKNDIVVRTKSDRVHQPCHRGNGRTLEDHEIHIVSITKPQTTAGPSPVRRTTRTPESHIEYTDSEYDSPPIPPPRERISNDSSALSSSNCRTVWLHVLLNLLLLLLAYISQVAPC